MFASQNPNWRARLRSNSASVSPSSSSNNPGTLPAHLGKRAEDFDSKGNEIRVLLVHHDRKMTRRLMDGLEELDRSNVRSGLAIHWVSDLSSAKDHLKHNLVDVVVLEPFLTDGPGIGFVDELEKFSLASIVMIGTKAAVEAASDDLAGKDLHVFTEGKLSREEVYWAIHDGYEKRRGEKALSRLGAGYRFGRICTL